MILAPLRRSLLIFAIAAVFPACADDVGKVRDLAWMAGEWASQKDGAGSEELWMAPKGGLMLGLHRDLFASGKAFFEYLRIEESPAGPVYLASPRGAEPTPFTLIEQAPGRAVFANPEHDWPKRITYWLENDGRRLCSEVGGDAGDRTAKWCWDRVDPP